MVAVGHVEAGTWYHQHAFFVHQLQRAIALAGEDPRRVLVLSTPDWGFTPYALQNGRDAAQVAREIDDFNAATGVLKAL